MKKELYYAHVMFDLMGVLRKTYGPYKYRWMAEMRAAWSMGSWGCAAITTDSKEPEIIR